MKTYKNLYPQIYHFGNLYVAFLAARKGKRDRAAVASFEFDLEHHLVQLEHAARRADEIGRLIGGWQRKRNQERQAAATRKAPPAA